MEVFPGQVNAPAGQSPSRLICRSLRNRRRTMRAGHRIAVAGAVALCFTLATRTHAVLQDGNVLDRRPGAGRRAPAGGDPRRTTSAASTSTPSPNPSRPGLPDVALPADFAAASQAQSAALSSCSETGSIVDVAPPGRSRRYIIGLPFPDDRSADDPQAGTKIVWNYFYSRLVQRQRPLSERAGPARRAAGSSAASSPMCGPAVRRRARGARRGPIRTTCCRNAWRA